MKKLIIKIGFFVGCMILAIVGCETQAETFDEFTSDGETIYIGRPDTVIVAPSGINKNRFFVHLNADPKIEKGEVRDLDGNLIHEFNVDRNALTDNVLEFELDADAEVIQTYNIVLFDAKGNSSVAREFSFSTFGNNYVATLLPRTISNILPYPSEAVVEFSSVLEGMTSTTFTYEDIDGETQIVEVSNAEDEIILENFKLEGQISVESKYRPTTNSVAEYTSKTTETNFPNLYVLNKSLIEVTTLTGDVGPDGCYGFPLERLFDGTGTMWHSCGPDTASAYPFTQTFDLGVTAKLSQFRLDQRGDCCSDRSPANYQIWGTAADIGTAETVDIKSVTLEEWEADAIDKGWVKLLDVSGNTDHTFEVEIPNDDHPNVRYFRMVVTAGIDGGDTANYAEYTLWATETE